MNEGLIIYNFYSLPLPRVCLSWQTAQSLMRCRIIRCLIWVSAVCIYSLFACIQPVPQVCTLNFRLAMPLLLVLFFSLSEISYRCIHLSIFQLQVYLTQGIGREVLVSVKDGSPQNTCRKSDSDIKVSSISDTGYP